MGQYPPPPPVAIGPGLDRPLYPAPDYVDPMLPPQPASAGYTMNRTRRFYQDQLAASSSEMGAPAFVFPDSSNKDSLPTSRSERRISGDLADGSQNNRR